MTERPTERPGHRGVSLTITAYALEGIKLPCLLYPNAKSYIRVESVGYTLDILLQQPYPRPLPPSQHLLNIASALCHNMCHHPPPPPSLRVIE